MANTSNTITLKNPITIDGKTVETMKYDINEITGLLFAEAEAKRKTSAGMKNIGITAAAEFDFGLHLYLGYAAIIAVNREYDFSDLERIHGRDVVEVMGIGRNFMLKSEATSPESVSDEQSEITPVSTTPVLLTSKQKD